MRQHTNWAGNVVFQAGTVHRPASVAELQQLIANSERIRAIGTAHSFSPVADTPGDLVSVAGLPPVVDTDTAAMTATISAGLNYSEVAHRLQAAGHGLANLASLPHIAVGGAVATGTHGSGDRNRSLAAAVLALELVTASGDLINVSRDSDPGVFPGLVVGLGAVGVVTSLTLRTVPAFTVRQWVYEDLPFDAMTADFDEITGAAYSVSTFTDWGRERVCQVWLKQQQPASDPPVSWLGGHLADGDRHPLAGLPTMYCTPQCGVPGPWHDRLPHFRAEFIPSAGDELQSEFLLGRENATEALAALDAMRTELASVTQVCEIRTVAADDLWLSPFYERDSVGLHFTWIPDAAAVGPVLADVEVALAPLRPRPHWGKLSTISPAVVAGLYPRLDDFSRVVADFDPRGTFRNEMVDAYLHAAA